MAQLKIGIISTADIARKICTAIHKSGVAIAYAVGSRDLEKAKQFAQENKVSVAYGSYDEVINDPNVQVVYVPLPTVLRTQWCIKAAEAGKAVLCDKPILNALDTKQIVDSCKKNNVHFMDCTMFMHHKRTHQIKELLQSPSNNPLGNLCRVNASFSINIVGAPDNIRWNANLEPYGCIGDLAWYCVRAILWVYNYELPKRVTAVATFKNECPVDCSAILQFEGDRHASLDSSFRNCRRQQLDIVGDKGCLSLNDFVLPFCSDPFWIPENPYTETTSFSIQNNNGIQTPHLVEQCLQEVEMIRTFAKDYDAHKNGSLGVSQDWGHISIATQAVLDAIYQSSKKGEPVELMQQ